MRVVEPLEEVCYLDRATLVAVDHPTNLEVYPDERFATAPPEPSGRVLVIGEKFFPTAARDETDKDVLNLVRKVDRLYPDFEKEPRFKGYAKDHWLDLSFEGPLPQGDVFLFLDGWVEYTYSHLNFKAHQAGVSLMPPSLEVPDEDGGWRCALREFGYPAGLPRTMAVPLPKEALNARRFRIRTNMEIFWDRVFVARDLGLSGITITERSPSEGILREYGYPKEFSPDGEEPTDYHRREPAIPFRNLAGDYTKFGNVLELVQKIDDRCVIFGKGEELALAFDVTKFPPVQEGHVRTFLLRSFGWCKDKDPYTAYPDSVEPLPFQEMGNYPYGQDVHPADEESWNEYRRNWNTRRILDR
jgi:hypothetical protein